MTRDDVKKLLMTINATYQNFTIKDLSMTIDTWYMLLEDQNPQTIFMAFKSYARNDSSGFAPTVGQLMNYQTEIESAGELSSTEAWMLVMKAMRNSTYNSVEEFEKLPPTVQKVIGSPSRLQSMGMNQNFNEGIEMRNFESAYKNVIDTQASHSRFDRNAIESMRATTSWRVSNSPLLAVENDEP